MSTRSGKRIHSSFHENTLKPELELDPQSERRPRSRRYRENVEELSDSVMKTKKRSNYVSFPTDDDVGADTVANMEEETKPARLLRRNALKERNLVATSTDSADPPTEGFKPFRGTRRTRKFAEDTEDARENHVEEVNREIKSKKEKKKKKSIPDETAEVVSKKKSKKKVKKTKKKTGSIVIEDILPESRERGTLNRINMSVDSFCSAAGSPIKNTKENGSADIISPPKDFKEALTLKSASDKVEGRQTRSVARLSRVSIPQSILDSVVKVTRKRKSSFKDSDKTSGNETVKNAELEEFDSTLTNVSKKHKSNTGHPGPEIKADSNVDEEIKDSTFDLEDLERRKSVIKNVINSTYDKSETPKSTETDKTFAVEEVNDENTTYEKELSCISTTQTPRSKLNSTYEKSNSKSPIELVNGGKETPAINTTFEKEDPIMDSATRKSSIINTTYEKDSITDTKQDLKVRTSSIINDTYDKNDASSDILSETEDSNSNLRKSTQAQKQSTEMNSTYDKAEKLDTTSEKDKKINTIFDKNSKSSLISSDYSNITLDKSDVSRISITSDDSKENIINTTPVLIESSLDESQLNTSKPNLTETKSVSQPKPVNPLKREGTFTKDGSDIIEAQVNLPTTPTRKMSLPSPGCTPFPNKSASKKSMMNITRSLEKSRRSSLAEPLPRATRVMFCSPVNDPMAVAQQRRKVIKSNLKGSNKSFVFEDAGPEPRAAPRKRSYTHGDVEEARVKRHRLAEGAPASAGRRPRPRTASAAAKLTDPDTPSKKTITTPRKSESKISRTKLPNFAALHQREFAKMESLDECQERKARRAKQLLTPTGAVTVLERSSPRDNPAEAKKPDEPKISPNLQKEDVKEQNSVKRPKDTKPPITPVKSLPTLKSLNPGYTRFGFKLNYDVNPFSITHKNVTQTCSNKKNTAKKDFTRPLKEIRGLRRQATLPSLAGATAARNAGLREACTDKRNRTRTENRTVIKGVRTNRRFELQMRMRNIE